jgi:hypothetical protein
MIIVLKPNITKKAEKEILSEIRKLGYKPHVMRGVARTVIGAIGDEQTHGNLETLTTFALPSRSATSSSAAKHIRKTPPSRFPTVPSSVATR